MMLRLIHNMRFSLTLHAQYLLSLALSALHQHGAEAEWW